jgi:hypothetical protein
MLLLDGPDRRIGQREDTWLGVWVSEIWWPDPSIAEAARGDIGSTASQPAQAAREQAQFAASMSSPFSPSPLPINRRLSSSLARRADVGWHWQTRTKTTTGRAAAFSYRPRGAIIVCQLFSFVVFRCWARLVPCFLPPTNPPTEQDMVVSGPQLESSGWCCASSQKMTRAMHAHAMPCRWTTVVGRGRQVSETKLRLVGPCFAGRWPLGLAGLVLLAGLCLVWSCRSRTSAAGGFKPVL